MDFAVPADHRVKLKESEKRDKYLDLARELKNYGTNKWHWCQFLIYALGTVTRRLVQGLEDLEIRGRGETIQTTALLRSTKILRRLLETWGDLLSNHRLTLVGKTLKGVNNNNNNNKRIQEISTEGG